MARLIVADLAVFLSHQAAAANMLANAIVLRRDCRPGNIASRGVMAQRAILDGGELIIVRMAGAAMSFSRAAIAPGIIVALIRACRVAAPVIKRHRVTDLAVASRCRVITTLHGTIRVNR